MQGKKHQRRIKALALFLAVALIFSLTGTYTRASSYVYDIPASFDPEQGWVEVRVIGNKATGVDKVPAADQIYVELWAFGLITQQGAVSIGYDSSALKPSTLRDETVGSTTYPANTPLETVYEGNGNADSRRYTYAVEFSESEINSDPASADPDFLFTTGIEYAMIRDESDAPQNYLVLEYELKEDLMKGSSVDVPDLVNAGVLNGIATNGASAQYGVNFPGRGACIMRASFQRQKDNDGNFVPLTAGSLWVYPNPIETISDLATGIYVHNGAVDGATHEGQKKFIKEADRVPFVMEGILPAPKVESVKAVNLNTGFSFQVYVDEVMVPDATGAETKKTVVEAINDKLIDGFVIYTPDGVRIEMAPGKVVEPNETLNADSLVKDSSSESGGGVYFTIAADADSSFIDYIVNGAGAGSKKYPTDQFYISCIKKSGDASSVTHTEGERVPFDLPPIIGMDLSFSLSSYAPSHEASIQLFKLVTDAGGQSKYHTIPYASFQLVDATLPAGLATQKVTLPNLSEGTYRLCITKLSHINFVKDAFVTVTKSGSTWTAKLWDGSTVSLTDAQLNDTEAVLQCKATQTVKDRDDTINVGDTIALHMLLICGDIAPLSDPNDLSSADGSVSLLDRAALLDLLYADPPPAPLSLPSSLFDLNGDDAISSLDLDVLSRFFPLSSQDYPFLLPPPASP